MKSANPSTIEISPALFAQAQAVAGEEHRSTQALVEEAVGHYLRRRQLQRLAGYGQGQAEKLGLTEEDVPRLIAESRRESPGQ